jgi:hypothetical protein
MADFPSDKRIEKLLPFASDFLKVLFTNANAVRNSHLKHFYSESLTVKMKVV